VTELCSGQALGDDDADNDTTDAADKSNPHMSPFQGDTKKVRTYQKQLSSAKSFKSGITLQIIIFMIICSFFK
jgi:hypothetical protein